MKRSGYRLFDADNHCYEPRDSFTTFIEPKYADCVVHTEIIDGEEVILVGDKPCTFMGVNEVFDRAGRPGSMKELLRSMRTELEAVSYEWDPMRPEYVERDARLRAMDEQGLESCILFPCMAFAVEHYFDDPDAMYASFRSFNRWYDERWGFNHQNRIYAVPMLSLRDGDRAVEELEWVLNRGARVVGLRTGPAYGRSPGDPYFDPFWARINEAKASVAFHLTESSYNAMFSTQWGQKAEPTVYGMSAWQWLHCYGDRPIMETISMLIYDNLFGRFPDVKVASIENGANWVRYLVTQMDKMRFMGRNGPWIGGPLKERPSEIFKRHVFVTPYPEEDVLGLIGFIGAQSVLMGSDWPHPEGLAEPADFVDLIAGLTREETEMVLFDNAASLVAE